MRLSYILLLCFAILVSACIVPEASPSPASSPTQASLYTNTRVPSSTQTLQPTRTMPPTRTRVPTDTPAPSPTDTPLPSLTPTLAPPITRTSMPAAECPKPSRQSPTLTFSEKAEDFASQILAYLNARGSAAGLPEALNSLAMTVDHELIHIESHIITKDVTGDAVPDIVIDLAARPSPLRVGAVLVFVCRAGQYETAAIYTSADKLGLWVEIQAIKDMNQDGVPEIVFVATDIAARASPKNFFIVEWDGNKFVDLVINPDPYDPRLEHSAIINNGDGLVNDTDGNGTLELVFTGGIELGFEYAPQRPRTDIWAWNGQAFTLTRSFFNEPPRYRFQAVQDGDDALRAGEDAKALVFYQQAIFDEKLWGYRQGFDEFDASGNRILEPDPEERPRLSAYARYRITLLHVVRGHLTEAQTVYNTLQSRFPAGVVGHPYAELAAVFWEDYQASRDIGVACSKVNDYAMAHEIFTPLMEGFYGFLSRDYWRDDICPFR